ncbi:cyclase-like protein 3 [Rosa rugosa]|uniref:cyclase-like protein 3 n=1 Tax=Rosa rugosa TaxID=74645 RepID=UPI002B4176CE|nr:cyclase-like protein 3 [Rosa rugosa]
MKSLNIPKGTRRVLFRTLNIDRGLMHKKEFDSSWIHGGWSKMGSKEHRHQTCCVHDSRVIYSQNSSEELETKPFSSSKDHEQDHTELSCCEECTSNYEKEAQLLKSSQQKLLAWLQTHGTEARQKEIVPVEGLKLDGIKPGNYSVHCLPLRLLAAEGALTRCILIK